MNDPQMYDFDDPGQWELEPPEMRFSTKSMVILVILAFVLGYIFAELTK